MEVRKSDIIAQHVKAVEPGADENPLEIFKQSSFVFKTWAVDTDSSVRKVFDQEQEKIVLRLISLEEKLQLEVMSQIQMNYQTFLAAWKIYLTYNSFPKSNFKKYVNFLE